MVSPPPPSGCWPACARHPRPWVIRHPCPGGPAPTSRPTWRATPTVSPGCSTGSVAASSASSTRVAPRRVPRRSRRAPRGQARRSSPTWSAPPGGWPPRSRGWTAPIGATVKPSVGEVPAQYLVGARLREVEVHHVDLGLRYTTADWPVEFVDRELTQRIAGLPTRLPPGTAVRLVHTGTGQSWELGGGPASVSVSGPGHAILAWLLGREAVGLDAPAGLPQ